MYKKLFCGPFWYEPFWYGPFRYWTFPELSLFDTDSCEAAVDRRPPAVTYQLRCEHQTNSEHGQAFTQVSISLSSVQWYYTNEQQERGCIEAVFENNQQSHPKHYIPHHRVRKDSIATPIRIVYDCTYDRRLSPVSSYNRRWFRLNRSAVTRNFTLSFEIASQTVEMLSYFNVIL